MEITTYTFKTPLLKKKRFTDFLAWMDQTYSINSLHLNFSFPHFLHYLFYGYARLAFCFHCQGSVATIKFILWCIIIKHYLENFRRKKERKWNMKLFNNYSAFDDLWPMSQSIDQSCLVWLASVPSPCLTRYIEVRVKINIIHKCISLLKDSRQFFSF